MTLGVASVHLKERCPVSSLQNVTTDIFALSLLSNICSAGQKVIIQIKTVRAVKTEKISTKQILLNNKAPSPVLASFHPQ